MLAAIYTHPWLASRSQALFLLLMLFTFNCVAVNNPKDDFCRRFSHQSTVIDDKLYIDGGWVNFDDEKAQQNYSNTWLGYHDLNHQGWPDFNFLAKSESIPTVAGGVLWPDSVNKRFYVYGGERTKGIANSDNLRSYDILNDQWDDLGPPDSSTDVAAYGAGVGVSETGMGYYYGGWVSNKSMSGWRQDRTMSSKFYSYDYEDNEFDSPSTIDDKPRAEGGMVWIPAGESTGLLVYMGGVIGQEDGTVIGQPFDEIFVYDTKAEEWYAQKATGIIPQNRRQFCIDVAWAPDRSSYNIYLSGGLAVYPPLTDAVAYSDIYILTMPSFTWVKAQPNHVGNSTGPDNGRYGSSCNMAKHMSQLLVIGGTFTKHGNCDAPKEWGMHNFWTGTAQNAGNNVTYWAGFDRNVDTNAIPIDVYNITGGDKHGGATIKAPVEGFAEKPLATLMSWNSSLPERTPTRSVAGATGSSIPTGSRGGSKLGTGAIIGVVIGCAVGLLFIMLVWYCFGKNVVRRREQKRQSQLTEHAQQMQHAQQTQHLVQSSPQSYSHRSRSHRSRSHHSYYGVSSTIGSQSLITPQSPPLTSWDAPSSPGSPDLRPQAEPSELPADREGNVVYQPYQPPRSPGSPHIH